MVTIAAGMLAMLPIAPVVAQMMDGAARRRSTSEPRMAPGQIRTAGSGQTSRESAPPSNGPAFDNRLRKFSDPLGANGR